jgi:rhamnosyltransferase
MKIGCILVLYRPNVELLSQVVTAVVNQLDTIFIVDNTPNPYALPIPENKIIYHRIGQNVGIAAAQNIGIRYFMEQKYDYIFFLDQDSIVEQNMLQTLLSTYKLLLEHTIHVGAVGPYPINRQSNKKYPIRRGKSLFPGITEFSALMSSGSLIQAEVFEQVGLMDEDLFIDNVDQEWCWRGRYHYGYRFFINEQTLLNHQLGSGDRFFIFKKITIPTPFRIYYWYRNYFWLLRRKYVPLYWKLSFGCKFFVRLLYYITFIPPQKEYFARVLCGIKDGIFMKRKK